MCNFPDGGNPGIAGCLLIFISLLIFVGLFVFERYLGGPGILTFIGLLLLIFILAKSAE